MLESKGQSKKGEDTMKLNDFEVTDERPLPVLILADVSGSMAENGKIEMLNNALREMIASLTKIEDIRGVFQVGIITFGETVEIHQPLTNVNNIVLKEMEADGSTPMGEAFETVANLVEDKNVVSSRAYAPTIVLVSDGQPTDIAVEDATYEDYIKWDSLKKLIDPQARTSKCLRLAMGIGDDADIDMLKAFVNNPAVPVIQSKNASGISNFFKWVTMSTVSRISSSNPNDPLSMLPTNFDFDKDEIIL